ncbi:MAG: enoyl-CoA hydratase-related protein, partial [Chloroflexota bacterium]
MSLILSELENGVCHITLNRPDALNAFTPDMLNELQTALEQAEANQEVNV